jgi:hypothetical protein
MWPVDAEGNVYVADLHQFEDDKGFPDAMTRVIKLAAGSDTPAVLPQFVHAGLMGRIPREPSGSRMPETISW